MFLGSKYMECDIGQRQWISGMLHWLIYNTKLLFMTQATGGGDCAIRIFDFRKKAADGKIIHIGTKKSHNITLRLNIPVTCLYFDFHCL